MRAAGTPGAEKKLVYASARTYPATRRTRRLGVDATPQRTLNHPMCGNHATRTLSIRHAGYDARQGWSAAKAGVFRRRAAMTPPGTLEKGET